MSFRAGVEKTGEPWLNLVATMDALSMPRASVALMKAFVHDVPMPA